MSTTETLAPTLPFKRVASMFAPMNTTTTCARCDRPIWENSAGGWTFGHPASGCSTTCGSTALLHTTDAELAARTNHEFR